MKITGVQVKVNKFKQDLDRSSKGYSVGINAELEDGEQLSLVAEHLKQEAEEIVDDWFLAKKLTK